MAINNGKLQPGPCEYESDGVCLGAIQAHHDDYSKPLDVRWLCRRHHKWVHRGMRGSPVPEKSVPMLFYPDPALRVEIRRRASEDERSLSSEISYLVKRGIKSLDVL